MSKELAEQILKHIPPTEINGNILKWYSEKTMLQAMQEYGSTLLQQQKEVAIRFGKYLCENNLESSNGFQYGRNFGKIDVDGEIKSDNELYAIFTQSKEYQQIIEKYGK